MAFDKDDLRYFWMDHKKKLIPAILIGGVCLIFVIAAVVSALNKPEEVVEEEPEIIEEEIHVGGIDVDEKIDELSDELAKEKDATYGLAYGIGDVLFDDDDMYFVNISGSDGDHTVIFTDKDMFDSLLKISNGTTLRGFLESLPQKEVDRLTEKYRRLLLDKFAENKKYKKDWDNSLSDGKVSLEYKKNEKRENIADDDWDIILEYAYNDFENKLNEKEDSEYAAYLSENPPYDFSKAEQMIGDWKICDENGEISCGFNREELAGYFENYWNKRIPYIDENLWENGKEICPRDITSGNFYSNIYKEDIYFKNNTGDFIIIWWLDDEYNIHEEYLWPNNINRGKNTGNSKYVGTVLIPGNMICFTYYYLGGEYDETRYFGGHYSDVTLNLSDYYQSTDWVELPRNIYYIKNDTNFDLRIQLDDDKFGLYVGNTLFVDGNTYNNIQITPND